MEKEKWKSKQQKIMFNTILRLNWNKIVKKMDFMQIFHGRQKWMKQNDGKKHFQKDERRKEASVTTLLNENTHTHNC